MGITRFSGLDRKGSRRWIHLVASVALCSAAFQAAGQTQARGNITPVTNFRDSSADDPFAPKGPLEVTSSAAPIAGLSGARAKVTVGCYEQGHFYLGFNIGITGADLDIVTVSTPHTDYHPYPIGNTTSYSQDRSVALKLRFDAEKTQYFSPKASDTRQVFFKDEDLETADARKQLLIGVTAGGSSVNLQLNLTENALKYVISQCHAKEAEEKRSVETKAKTEETKKKLEEENVTRANVDRKLAAFVAKFRLNGMSVPEDAKFRPDPNDSWYIILKAPRTIVVQSGGFRMGGETLPAGTLMKIFAEPLDTNVDSPNMHVQLSTADPWVSSHYSTEVSVRTSDLVYGSVKEWMEREKQFADGREDYRQQMRNKLKNALASLGPIPEAAKECFSKECLSFTLSFKTLQNTSVITGDPVTGTHRAELPAGSQICTLDISEVKDGFIYMKGLENTTFILPGGEKLGLREGWVSINALAYDTKHPKHIIIGQ